MDLAMVKSVEDVERAVCGAEIDAVYCFAGKTAVDLCEDEPERAMGINCRGPEMLARLAAKRGARFVFFSTEYVFDGVSGPYTEVSKANPISVYGKTKRQGELAVMAAHSKSLVLRTTVVYGPDRAPKDSGRQNNYLYTVMKLLGAGKALRVPEDQISTPSYNRDVTGAAVRLMERGAAGVFHVCGPEILNRLEFAQGVAAELGLDGRLLQGVETSVFGQKAARPLNAGLLTEKLQREYPELRMRGYKEALEDCRRECEEFLEGVRG